ncbi:MAG: hypothetical protein AUI14_04125 [Actinobacteria bacterium 13_2_20CM_2_71_6]|nr:MAG: hypothetical protein AUI14_04125 [Actinobacteria bacterium 13_2_20CM_2_71_6]
MLLLAVALAGCSSAAKPAAGPQPATRLTATLVATDMKLQWQGGEPDAAGRVVEFASEPDGQYTVLEFVAPQQTTYTHPDVMPDTTFYYRVRPYFGPASAAVQLELPQGPFDENAQQDDNEWAAPRTVAHGSVATQPIRNSHSAAAAVPTDLAVAVVHANGVKLTWTDHASDEEGYLVEVKPAGSADFHVAAVVDPDINSFGLVTLPNEKAASFRVRAFYYGNSSNVAHQKTGPQR